MIKTIQASLSKALKQLQAERARIDQQISAVSEAMGTLDAKASTRAQGGKRRGRRKMSAAQKRAVGLRMKAYWAKRRAAKGSK